MSSEHYKDGFHVAPLSRDHITNTANALRQHFDIKGYFPIVECLEFAHMNFLVKSAQEMGSNLGLTRPQGEIWIREDVYDGACDGDGFHRFTIAHEIGHAILHANQIGFARAFNHQQHKVYCNSEWQANEFAGGLLVSRQEIMPYDTANDIARRFGVSYSCAEHSLNKIKGR